MAKKENKTLERTYNVPLRKEYRKVPRWRRTKKAVSALRQFLSKHMKSEDIKLGLDVNEQLWKHGIRNPPHHIKVNATKDEKGVVNVELFGEKKVSRKKKDSKKEVKKEPAKKIEEKTTEKKEKPKVESQEVKKE